MERGFTLTHFCRIFHKFPFLSTNYHYGLFTRVFLDYNLGWNLGFNLGESVINLGMVGILIWEVNGGSSDLLFGGISGPYYMGLSLV